MSQRIPDFLSNETNVSFKDSLGVVQNKCLNSFENETLRHLYRHFDFHFDTNVSLNKLL